MLFVHPATRESRVQSVPNCCPVLILSLWYKYDDEAP
jgi:hypothetical protein